MKFLIILGIINLAICQPSQKSQKQEQIKATENMQKLQELLKKLRSSTLNSSLDAKKVENLSDLKTTSRKSKSLPIYPFFNYPVPFGSPGFFYPPKQNTFDNSYPNEMLSRTEPFKKNPALLDSPTYYIRLPPNPYVFIPGVGYVSRPPSLSDPEVLDSNKPEQINQVGNDILHEPFYRLPINFVSNGKPTGVYQLPNGPNFPKPESSQINLNKGPYVFNGKPSEIFLIAQIYDALYGDELTHFYP